MAILHTTHEGTLKFHVINSVSGIESIIEGECVNLNDGSRLIAESVFLELLGRSPKIKGNDKKNETDKLPPFIAAQNLKPFINKHIKAPTNTIWYISKTNQKCKGYFADLLPQVCQVFKSAYRSGALKKSQEHIFQRCDLIIDSLAGVAITALVDEATGYQYVRPKDTLQALLKLYVQPTPNAWERRFTENFYEGICKLKNWKYDPKRRTSAFSYLTVDLIYKRIQPQLWEELKKSNPDKNKYRYHQMLTDNIGNPHLCEHLRGIIRLMNASSNWNSFMASVNHYYPINNQIQMDIFFDLMIQSSEDFEKYKDLVS